MEGESCYNRFLQGDESALIELIAAYRPGLTAFLRSFTGDGDAAEELALDSFAALVCSRSPFRGASSFKTYLYRIGRNEALRWLKKNRRSEQLPLEELAERLPADGEGPDAAGERTERARQLRQAMQRLPADYREVLRLLYFAGLTPAEAGAVLGKNSRQTANLTYRAKQSLKQILLDEGFEYDE